MSDAQTRTSSPPRCRCTMQVGVVGHRALPDADPHALNERLRDVLARVASAVNEICLADRASAAPLFSRDAPLLRCLSALAEGADRLVARQALALGYKLAAPLPFHREVYRADFRTGGSAAEFDRLLAQASAVLELDGSREREDAAYEAAGRVILEQSDLMIAIWDGLPARGVGGTAQMVAEAEERGIPLIVIDPAAPHAVRHQGLSASADWREALAQGLPPRLVPPASAEPGDARSLARAFFAEAVDPGICAGMLHGAAGGLYRGFEAAWLVGSARAVRGPRVEGFPEQAGAPAAQVEARIAPAQSAADRLAVRYANLYRASWILRYGLLLPALVGGFIGSFASDSSQWAGFVLQVAALGGILVVWWLNKRQRWHQRFIDYRFIAEHLRQARHLALLGGTVSLPRPRPYEDALPADWAAWYVRTAARALGLVSARIDARYLRDAARVFDREIEGQGEFYEERAERFAVIGRRLELFAYALFTAGFLALAARAAVFVFPSPAAWHRPVREVCLIVPALAPVFMGLRGQAEYARLAGRYRAMAQLLRAAKQEVGDATASRAALDRATRGAVSVMLAEVSDWRELIKARTVTFL